MTEKYINPFTDFGFKKLFGEEVNKDLLIDFLNELIQEQGKIIDLTYLKNEHVGMGESDRKAIFDLYCENERGEKFIVELQKAKQKFFKDRSIYYSTFPIQEQAQTGEWSFELKTVYTVAIMDFVFEEEKMTASKFRHDVQLMDINTCKVFYPKLRFIYLEMPKFNQSEAELTSRYEKWLFVLKNLAKLEERPRALQEKVFQKLFDAAEIARYDKKERQAYQDSLKYYRDLKNVFDTYREEGFEEGYEEGLGKGLEQGLEQGKQAGRIEIVRKGLQNGLDVKTLSLLSGFTEEEIAQLKNNPGD